MIEPGQIYWANLSDSGRRPVIIVSRESLNRGAYALVVPITSSGFDRRRDLPNSVAFRAGEFGLTASCVAQCEVIIAAFLDQLDRAGGPIGQLDSAAMRSVIRAIGHVIEAECEPD